MLFKTAQDSILRDLSVGISTALDPKQRSPAMSAKAVASVDYLQVIAKAGKNFPERTALHLVDFEPVVLVGVAFQDDF